MSASENRQVLTEAAGNAPGRRLAEARQAQHQSAADIARQLKLSVAQVEALESGHYERLPGPIFVRGFIRNYARLVRLDPNELLSAADATVPRAAPPPDRTPSENIPYPGESRRRWPLAVAALVVVAALAAYEMYWDDAASISPPTETASAPAQPPAPAGDAGNVSAPVAVARSESTTERTAELPVQPDSPAVVAPEGVTATAPAAQSAPKAGEKRVMLEFEEESWVEIRDRNERVIFSQLNQPGTQRQVDGLPPFSVVVGNAPAVRLTFDGRTVDLGPHTRVDVARLILQ